MDRRCPHLKQEGDKPEQRVRITVDGEPFAVHVLVCVGDGIHGTPALRLQRRGHRLVKQLRQLEQERVGSGNAEWHGHARVLAGVLFFDPHQRF